jgi:hypothetical protein
METVSELLPQETNGVNLMVLQHQNGEHINISSTLKHEYNAEVVK